MDLSRFHQHVQVFRKFRRCRNARGERGCLTRPQGPRPSIQCPGIKFLACGIIQGEAQPWNAANVIGDIADLALHHEHMRPINHAVLLINALDLQAVNVDGPPQPLKGLVGDGGGKNQGFRGQKRKDKWQNGNGGKRRPTRHFLDPHLALFRKGQARDARRLNQPCHIKLWLGVVMVNHLQGTARGLSPAGHFHKIGDRQFFPMMPAASAAHVKGLGAVAWPKVISGGARWARNDHVGTQ